ncbi:cytochrome b5 domain-containing protein [Thiovibrio sp. JS02]
MQRRNHFMFLLIAIVTLLLAGPATATEEYAAKTGTACEVCHLDPLGGGELTAAGEGYFLAISPAAASKGAASGLAARIIRFMALYIHIMTAFLWFGTILYVHLVLKPAYASKGLPRGEVRVGLVSMVIMALSGAVLTYYKVPAFGFFVSSKFGILLLVKICIFITMVSSALFVVVVIGPRLKRKKMIQPSPAGQLTLAELANFDGEDGRPAYFAYRDNIYDASRSRLWKNGSHMKRHQAGVDLTEILSQAPHGEDKILALPVVGRLAREQAGAGAVAPEKIFYFMAHMNLGFVFVICFILALWRW